MHDMATLRVCSKQEFVERFSIFEKKFQLIISQLKAEGIAIHPMKIGLVIFDEEKVKKRVLMMASR